MTLIRTSLLNGVAVAVRMLTMLGLNKLLAVYVGPVGYAAVGQFQNAVQMITTFAGGSITTGVTKYTAEYHADAESQRRVWRTAGSIALIGSTATALLIALFNRQLAAWFLKDPAYGGVFLWFAATLGLFVFNALLLAILNGKKEVGRYVIANISGSVFAFLITGWLVSVWGLYGALVGLAVFQSAAFLVTAALCLRSPWFRMRDLIGPIDQVAAKNLAKFTLMALTTAVCMPLSHILVRNHLGTNFGWAAAGYWEAMWRLSSAYLMLVTTTLSIYYLPRLSELIDPVEIRRELLHGYRIILPLAVLGGTTIFVLREWLIGVLFTESFLPMRELFRWQLTGDALKIASWVLAYLMLSKAMFVPFIGLEIGFSAGFVALVFLLTPLFGLSGAVMAYAFNYLLYWVAIYAATRHHLHHNISRVR